MFLAGSFQLAEPFNVTADNADKSDQLLASC